MPKKLYGNEWFATTAHDRHASHGRHHPRHSRQHPAGAEGRPCLRLGSNIVARTPDVEIAALTLKEIPLTADK